MNEVKAQVLEHKIVEIPDNGNNKKIKEGERMIDDQIKQAKRIIQLKNEGSAESGRGGTITDDSMEEMQDLTFGDLKPSGVSDSLALSSPETEHRAQEIYNKFTQRFNVLLTSNFGTKMERTLQQAFPEGTSFVGYLQRATIILSILYNFPDADPTEIVNALRRHRVLYRNMMMWNRRMLNALQEDLMKTRTKKATSSDKGSTIRKYPKYQSVLKRDFNKTVRKLHTPKASISQVFSGDELLIEENLKECLDAMKDAEYRGDKDDEYFWKTEIGKLNSAMEMLKRRERHMKHAASAASKKILPNPIPFPTVAMRNKSILKHRIGRQELDPRSYIGTLIEGPLNIAVLFDGTTDTYSEEETGAIISDRRLVQNPWLELTADGYRKIHQMAENYDKKMPPMIKKTDETTKTQPTDYYERKLQPSMKKVVDKEQPETSDIGGSQPVGGDPNKLVKVFESSSSKPFEIGKTIHFKGDGYLDEPHSKERTYFPTHLNGKFKIVENVHPEPGSGISDGYIILEDEKTDKCYIVDYGELEYRKTTGSNVIKLESADKSKLRQRMKSHKENLRHLKEMRTNVTAEKAKSKDPGKYIDRVSKLNNRIRKEEEQISKLQNQISKTVTKAEVETSTDSVEADIVPSSDPHIVAHDDLEVHLNGAGFALEMIHPETDAFRTYVAWYHGVPLSGVGSSSGENKSTLGGAFFAACEGTDFVPAGEGWSEETDDDGEKSEVFKMIDKKSKTSCCANVANSHINFYATA